jgi:predicted GIY-YIG superfamily endonuclease
MTYSIYVFVDDRNRPYYVGKTNNMHRRKNEHKELILKGDRLPKYHAARSLIHKGVPFRMKVIRTTTIEDEAWKLERYFIQNLEWKAINFIIVRMVATMNSP